MRFLSFSAVCAIFSALPAHGQLDTNGNTMSDVWERAHNSGQLFPPGFLPGGDEDADGRTNFEESVAGTDPQSPTPPDGFLIKDLYHVPATWLSDPGGGEPELITPESYIIEWFGILGKSYQLHCSPDLSPGSWLPVGDPIIGYGSDIGIGAMPQHLVGSEPARLFWKLEVSDIDTDGDGLTDYEEHVLGSDRLNGFSYLSLPDLWFATHFPDAFAAEGVGYDANGDTDEDGTSDFEELVAGTDPNVADAAGSARWVAVQGNGIAGTRIPRTRQFTVPAGQSAILIVAIASDEFSYYTDPDTSNEYNDVLDWNIEPSVGDAIDHNVNVNDRHSAWVNAATLGQSLPGMSGPVHYEEIHTLTAPTNEPLTIDVEIGATNIEDAEYPSQVAVGVLPLDLDIQYLSQTGINELEEPEEDVGDGGYISLKSQTHLGEDITPTTYVVIKPISGSSSDMKTRLKFDAGGRYKVARDRLGADEVISEDTEFPAKKETRLYLVGDELSDSRGAEEISMQVKIGGEWIDGDSLKATVVQTQFHVDLRVFIPYNWVNIPFHPLHLDEVAKGDHRTYDPSLSGTYRVAQEVTLNIYPEWVPEAGNRLIDERKWAGLTQHFKTDDVTNFNIGAKHSEDTTITPSYINAGAAHSNSGTADLSQVNAAIVTTLTNDDECFVRFEGSAKEPIILGAAAIDWKLTIGVLKIDPLNPDFAMTGEHDGFPAYEIYINSKHPSFPHTTCLQWDPPLSSGVLELSTNLDVSVGPSTGAINK